MYLNKCKLSDLSKRSERVFKSRDPFPVVYGKKNKTGHNTERHFNLHTFQYARRYSGRIQVEKQNSIFFTRLVNVVKLIIVGCPIRHNCVHTIFVKKMSVILPKKCLDKKVIAP